MKHEVYARELLAIGASLSPSERSEFATRFAARALNPTKVFGLSVFLGGFGADRFALDQPLLGVLKIVTLGGLGFWSLIDLFRVAGMAREKNLEIARELAAKAA